MEGIYEVYLKIYAKIRSGKILTDEDIVNYDEKMKIAASLAVDHAKKEASVLSKAELEEVIDEKIAS